MNMVKKRIINIINVSLIMVSFLLILNLFGIQFPNLGYTVYNLMDTDSEVCFVEWKDSSNQIDIANCCHEVRKQLSCENKKNLFNNFETDITCKTGDGDVLKYHLNNKAYRYCQEVMPNK